MIFMSPLSIVSPEPLNGLAATPLMAPLRRALFEHEHANHDEPEQNAGGRIAAQGETAVGMWLIEEIAHHGAQGPGKDECSPEQRSPGNARPEIGGRDDRQ